MTQKKTQTLSGLNFLYLCSQYIRALGSLIEQSAIMIAILGNIEHNNYTHVTWRKVIKWAGSPDLLLHCYSYVSLADHIKFTRGQAHYGYQCGCLSGNWLVISLIMVTLTCILSDNTCALQSPCYKYAKNINCPVTIVDFYSEPIVDLDDASLTRRCNENSTYIMVKWAHVIHQSLSPIVVKYYEHEISFGYDVPTSYMYRLVLICDWICTIMIFPMHLMLQFS